MEYFENIRVVLIEPSHPGNIGAVARSMKTMGLSRLVLVKPKIFPHVEATKRAASADNVLQSALVVNTLSEAIDDCTLVLGTSVRDREVTWPTVDPRMAASNIQLHVSNENQQAAILFGRESSGLRNEEMDLCHAQIRIAANEEYSSLNLASAVQIIAYEIRMAALQDSLVKKEGQVKQKTLSPLELRQKSATSAQYEAYLEHLQQTLEQLDFIKSKPPTMLMRKLSRLYNKARLSVEEIQILRGILTAIQTQDKRSN